MTKVFEKNALDVWCEENKKTVDTPFSIADKTIKICCRDKEIIEDVIFYLRAYLRREYGEDDITECLDREIANARQQYLKKRRKAAAMIKIKEIYNNNKSFREYCDKAIERGEAPSLEALLTHKMIHHVAQYYLEHEGLDKEQV